MASSLQHLSWHHPLLLTRCHRIHTFNALGNNQFNLYRPSEWPSKVSSSRNGKYDYKHVWNWYIFWTEFRCRNTRQLGLWLQGDMALRPLPPKRKGAGLCILCSYLHTIYLQRIVAECIRTRSKGGGTSLLLHHSYGAGCVSHGASGLAEKIPNLGRKIRTPNELITSCYRSSLCLELHFGQYLWPGRNRHWSLRNVHKWIFTSSDYIPNSLGGRA